MRCDCDDRDVSRLRAVAPEDAIRGGRTLLGVRLEDLRGPWPRQARVLVRLEARVSRVAFQEPEGLPYGLRALGESGICFECRKVRPRLAGEAEAKRRAGHGLVVERVVGVGSERAQIV